MLRFEDIKTGQILTGVEQEKCSEVIMLQIISTNSATLFYRFMGNVKIDPMMGKTDIQSIFDEVIQPLYEYTRTNVTVTLEIGAITDSPSGFDSGIQRTLRENSRQLNFNIAEFEQS